MLSDSHRKECGLCSVPQSGEIAPANREYWTPGQLAELLSLHPSTVIRMFQDEPGVLKLNHKRMLRGRPHVTLRVPDPILQRKIREWSK